MADNSAVIAQCAFVHIEAMNKNLFALLDTDRTWELLTDFVRLHPELIPEFDAAGAPTNGRSIVYSVADTIEKYLLLLIDRGAIAPVPSIKNFTPEAMAEIEKMRARVAHLQPPTPSAPIATEVVDAAPAPPTESELDEQMIQRFKNGYDATFKRQYAQDKTFKKRFDRLNNSGRI